MMRRLLVPFLAGIMILVAFNLFSEDENVNKVIARLGDKVITQKDVEKEMSERRSQYPVRNIPGMPEDEKLKQERFVVNRYLERLIILDEAKQKGLDVTNAEIQEKVDMIKSRFPDEKTFEMVLSRQKATVKDLEDRIRETMTIARVMDSITPTTPTVTVEEIKKFYDDNPTRFKKNEEVRASHILVKVDKGASEAEKKEAREKIEDIRKRLEKGEDFAKLAEEYSDCPSGKRSGGDLDWFGRGRMVPAFEKAAFSLEKGKISDIVATDFGFHIIKVTEKKEAGTISLDEIKQELEDEMIHEIRVKNFMDWLQKEKKNRVVFMDSKYEEQEEKTEQEK